MTKLVNMYELSRMAGYSATYISQHVKTYKTLPEPDVQLGKRWFYSPELLKKVLKMLPPNNGVGRPKKQLLENHKTKKEAK